MKGLLLLSIGLLCGCTETRSWNDWVVALDTQKVEVAMTRTSGKSIGSLHTFLMLGPAGSEWTAHFTYRGKGYKFKSGMGEPILLSLSPTREPILGTVAGEYSDFGSHTLVRFHQAMSNDDWVELPVAKYPLEVVVPNFAQVWSGVPREKVQAFPHEMHHHLSTRLVSLWQTICRIPDADLPFPDRIDTSCIDRLKLAAATQWALEAKAQ